MKPYRLLTWLFVASLLLNVQSAFACTMMPDMPDIPEPTHECCLARHGGELSEAPDSARSVSDTCFTLKISLQIKASPEADADPGNDHALVKDKKEAQDQTLAMALIILTVLRAPGITDQSSHPVMSRSAPIFLFTRQPSAIAFNNTP